MESKLIGLYKADGQSVKVYQDKLQSLTSYRAEWSDGYTEHYASLAQLTTFTDRLVKLGYTVTF